MRSNIQIEIRTIEYEIIDRTAVVSLNRPEFLNALNEGMKEDLKKALLKAQSDDHIRVIVL